MAQSKAQIAERGKAAEREVKKYLGELSLLRFDFEWERVYDARSAGGKFPSRTGDFQYYFPGKHGVIEVKEVHHAFRLPEKNFPKQGISKLYKRQLSGGDVIVVVRFMTTGEWRLVPLSFFRERLDQASWDLTQFKTVRKVSELLERPLLFREPVAP